MLDIIDLEIRNLSPEEKEKLFNQLSYREYPRTIQLKEKQEHFENLLNKIKEFKNHKDPVIANKARTISAKEEREYFLSSRNFILKKIREAFSIGKKQYPVIRGTDREPVWEPEPYWAYTFNKWRKKFSR
ncbi:hypothetical protein [Mesomycoplasma hyopneumoniae]|uniref:hypothetical protein n=1 Tax=Mesomycoplasma hyopneumoniae TaxID=2099 RepID=UPI001F0A12EA|nr:hypothetical protein [Mesomycoplasma hyopneumoniae]